MMHDPNSNHIAIVEAPHRAADPLRSEGPDSIWAPALRQALPGLLGATTDDAAKTVDGRRVFGEVHLAL